jgi:hypothetical protein
LDHVQDPRILSNMIEVYGILSTAGSPAS